MSKGTLAPEPLGCLEEQRWDQTLGVGVELKAVLHFSALGFRSYECGCPREYTGLQPACDGVRGWVSLSPIFNPPPGGTILLLPVWESNLDEQNGQGQKSGGRLRLYDGRRWVHRPTPGIGNSGKVDRSDPVALLRAGILDKNNPPDT